jgi:RNA polymerase sigma-70 factor (ECF subfamily)
MKLWEKQNSISFDQDLLPYLYTIAKNTFLNNCQHEAIKYVYRNYVLTNFSANDDKTEQELDSLFLEDFFETLVDLLPPKRKKVFLMSRKENMSSKEIAKKLNVSQNTVETHLHLALKTLKKQMEAHCN